MLISLLALLLLAAQAQAAGKEAMAVLVVGVDSWMYGDVLAHYVGEELNRSRQYAMVTREKFVQTKLKALRRASGDLDICELCDWAEAQGLSQVCLVEAKKRDATTLFSFKHETQAYSARLINVAGRRQPCSADLTFHHSGAPGKMTSAELTKVAWELAGRLQSSSCKPVSYATRCLIATFGASEPAMVFVEGGTFDMGCKKGRDDAIYEGLNLGCENNDTSVVSVSDFWIGKYEVTQAEWREVMKNRTSAPLSNPSAHKSCDSCPVEQVSWDDVQIFLDSLNVRTGRKGSGHEYRLPTEGQWEYAARGGREMNKRCAGGCRYSGSDTVGHVAWYIDNAEGTPHGVGMRKTGAPAEIDGGNELGIHDMSGNVWEWCADSWQESLPVGAVESPYSWDEACNSCSGSTTSTRTVRGGSYNLLANDSRVASRESPTPTFFVPHLGFRVVLR
ncbi:MAG: formylglycine-generating enzyme family protein [Prevotellaceae bacterium]|nr:formylglycine-generating enzyme family protein [Prevotellaceae bacterium]